MKKILFLLIFAITLIACCEQKYDDNEYHETVQTNQVYVVNGVNLHVVEIDSCEYLIGNMVCGYQGYGYLTHKGNCKYCAERRKRELNNKHK